MLSLQSQQLGQWQKFTAGWVRRPTSPQRFHTFASQAIRLQVWITRASRTGADCISARQAAFEQGLRNHGIVIGKTDGAMVKQVAKR